jgi:hypothetical protein
MSRYTQYLGNNWFTIIKGKEDDFKKFKDKYEFGNTLLHEEPPIEIGGNWRCCFSTRDGDTDINHFSPEEQGDWFVELSTYIEEEIDFICLDEEFPLLNKEGFAYKLYCYKGIGKLTDLKLIEGHTYNIELVEDEDEDEKMYEGN